jgi:hypothetical protein
VRDRDLASYEGRIAAECLKDDRVATVEASVTAANLLPLKLRIAVYVTPRDPAVASFTLLLTVTSGQALLEAITAGKATA